MQTPEAELRYTISSPPPTLCMSTTELRLRVSTTLFPPLHFPTNQNSREKRTQHNPMEALAPSGAGDSSQPPASPRSPAARQKAERLAMMKKLSAETPGNEGE